MPINTDAIRKKKQGESLALQAPRFDDVLEQVKSDFPVFGAKQQKLSELADKLAETVYSCRKTIGVAATNEVLAKHASKVDFSATVPTAKPFKTANLPDIEQAEAELKDLTQSELFTSRFCCRTGAHIGDLSESVKQQFAALLANEQVALEWLNTFTGQKLLAFHGLSPLWVRTDNKALMMLRRVDPVGYLTYLIYHWYSGEGMASDMPGLQCRIDTRAALQIDKQITEKINLLEVCARTSCATLEHDTLAMIKQGCTSEQLRDAVAAWLVKYMADLKLEQDTIDNTLAALTRGRLSAWSAKRSGIPSNIAAIQRVRENITKASVSLEEQYELAAILGGAGYDVPPLALSQLAETESVGRYLRDEQQQSLADMFGSWDVAENYEIKVTGDDESDGDDVELFDGFGFDDFDSYDTEPVSDAEFLALAEGLAASERDLTETRKAKMSARQTDDNSEARAVYSGDIFGDIDLGSL